VKRDNETSFHSHNMPLPQADLLALDTARLDDARVLLAGGRPDGAAYLCGYAIELALKACVCRTLGWVGYPTTRKEFEGYSSFKTHSLEVLLHLSGRESFVRTHLLVEWSIVATWDPEMRYQPVGNVTAVGAQAMITATDAIVRQL
jgi:hypothetical protein